MKRSLAALAATATVLAGCTPTEEPTCIINGRIEDGSDCTRSPASPGYTSPNSGYRSPGYRSRSGYKSPARAGYSKSKSRR